MPFTGNEDYLININDAAAMNRAFRKAYSGQSQGMYVSKRTIMDLLNQTDCVGIRFYFAVNTDYKLCLTYAGVLANENDILGLVGGPGVLCPPSCGAANQLNS